MNKPDTIRLWRLAARMNQTQFGKLVGKSRNAVSDWERGKYKTSDAMVIKLQGLLRIPKSKHIVRTPS